MTPNELALTRYVEACRLRGDTERTATGRESLLRLFLVWCAERGIEAPNQVGREAIERYRRHLYYWQREDGRPLGLEAQRNRLSQVKLFFRWLVRENWIAANPASELELPRTHRRLPKAILTREEVERVLAQTQVHGEAGLRDRAVLETLYATGIRRLELIGLTVYDVDTQHGTLMVREGKGKKDRLLPIGERACRWIGRYVQDVRPGLVTRMDERTLFLSDDGQKLRTGWLTDRVRHYFDAVGIEKPGACHLFRHTMATLMLENGADLRYIQAMLGHASIETTTIYTHVALAKLREVYERTHPAKMVRTSTGDAAA
ncbi:MAG: site-specific tyrosine recombinase XerC [Rudaea sp.]|uniref:site-specific tyrosine recombinase XerC n=1 Tax=Rudaea sp. TaxID=2136325 RepID=UPI0039E62434